MSVVYQMFVLEIVPEQVVVLFWAGTMSHRSSLGTFLFRSRTMRSIFARYLAYTIVILLLIQSINVVYFASCINTGITSIYLNVR